MESSNKLKTVKEFKFYRRNLPYYEDPGNVYFITFRTTGGIILSDIAKDIIFTTIKFHAGKKYKLYCCIVMDTHVHCILQPLEESKGTLFSLSQIMHSIKSYSANKIQRTSNLSGKFWQDENYDRVIRDDSEFLEKMEYIISNPLKAGMVENPDKYKWLYYEGSD
jgi:putative transposase